MDNLPPGYDPVSDPQQIFGIESDEPAPETVKDLMENVSQRAAYAMIKTCFDAGIPFGLSRDQVVLTMKVALTDYEERRKRLI